MVLFGGIIMNELKENALTIVLILIIILVIVVFGFAAWKIMQPDTKTNEDLAAINNFNQVTSENESIENDDENIIEEENIVNENSSSEDEIETDMNQEDDMVNDEDDFIEGEENIKKRSDTNSLYVKKYEERRIYKSRKFRNSKNFS